MRAVVTDPEAPGSVRLGERPDATAAPGEVLVRVSHFSLNRGEVNFAGGKPAGSAIGWDVVGTVAATPEGGPEVGARVVGFSGRMEGWAEQVSLPVDAVAPVPEGVTAAAAAALPVAAGTALACLDAAERGLLGRRVLVTGVTGGVGGFAVRLARLAGAHVVAQVRKDGQVAYAEGLGADHVVVTSDGAGLAEAGPFDLVVDGIGGALFAAGMAALDADGRAVNYGLTGSPEVAYPLGAMLGKGLATARGLNLYAVNRRTPPAEWLPRLLRLVEAGRLTVDVEERGDWSGVSAACQGLLDRAFTGKAVLTVGG